MRVEFNGAANRFPRSLDSLCEDFAPLGGRLPLDWAITDAADRTWLIIAVSRASHCINIHHSFLRGFKGARPYRRALEKGIELIGASAHFKTAELDEGPIIEQSVERRGSSGDERGSYPNWPRLGGAGAGPGGSLDR